MKRSVFLAALALLPTAALAQKPAPAPLYDEKASGAAQIETALVEAKKSGKVVLLQFGANWCGWCHKLHKLCAADPAIAAELKKGYVTVLIDVNQKHNDDIDQRYGNPTRFGLPVIVLLDKTGKPLTTQDTGKLEVGDRHDPAKVLAFLKQWAPKK